MKSHGSMRRVLILDALWLMGAPTRVWGRTLERRVGTGELDLASLSELELIPSRQSRRASLSPRLAWSC